MVKNPKVSVIVPLYNKEKWIGRCIESILSQSYWNIEVIIINDGSTDNSSGAIPRGDDRLYISHTLNHGVSCARNSGLNHARGEFVMFVDADDYLEPEAIKKLVEASNGVDLVIGAFRKVGAMSHEVPGINCVAERRVVAEYVMENLYNPACNQLLNGCWAKLFRRSIINVNKVQFPVMMRTAEDMGFNFLYLKYCNKVGFISDVIYNNYKHGDYKSLSTQFNARDPYGLFGFVIGLSYVRLFLREFFNEIELDRAIANSYIYHVILYFIRICGQADILKSREIMRSVTRQPEFRRRLAAYRVAPGNYRLIPWLLRRGWAWPIMLACRLEARRFYS